VHRSVLLSFCALAICALTAGAASAQSLLPPMFGDWSIAQSSTSGPNTLDQAAGDNASIFREYGFEAIEHQQYARGAEMLDATLYRMTDPTAAYGAFTFLRTPDMHGSDVARYAAASANRALIVAGNFLLDVQGAHVGERPQVLKSLVSSVQPKADKRPFPIIGEHLPTDNLIAGSERYYLGPLCVTKDTGLPANDWEGFGTGAEAISAKYRKGGQEATLMIIEYPTQQIAAKQFSQVQSVAASASSETPSAAHPKIIVKRLAGIISIAFDDESGSFGANLINGVAYGHDVTWNEPSYKAKEPSINIMVVGAFVGTGVILLLAVITGLGFAILRVVTKIFFPGKVFDRPQHIEILQLGLTGRRTDTRDLY
jgi:hypothetical protein